MCQQQVVATGIFASHTTLVAGCKVANVTPLQSVAQQETRQGKRSRCQLVVSPEATHGAGAPILHMAWLGLASASWSTHELHQSHACPLQCHLFIKQQPNICSPT
jgi:hypothetical protein